SLHAREPPHPDKTIRTPPIAELSDQRHAHCFLRLDEVPLEQLDQDFTLPRLQRVLAQLDDPTAPLPSASGGHRYAGPWALPAHAGLTASPGLVGAARQAAPRSRLA